MPIAGEEVSLDRARVRVAAGQVSEMSWLTWDVTGVPSYGDVLPFYVVWFNTTTKTYQCACRENQLIERLCEHVVAVVVYRNTHGDKYVGTVSGQEEQPDIVPEHLDQDVATLGSANDTVADLVGPLPKPSEMEWGWPPLPEWVSDFRKHQWDAAFAVVESFDAGARVVFLDAPTGSGKTLIGEMVRRIMGQRALYICSDKALQDQFSRDFDYAKVLKGRTNYPTLNETANQNGITAGDCDKRMDTSRDERVCTFCGTNTQQCPYELAKREALLADLAVLNTTYYLTEVNNVGRFGSARDENGDLVRRGLVIVDECDLLETELMRFIEFYVGEGALRRLGLNAPKKGSHHKTIADWLIEDFSSACQAARNRIDRNTVDNRERRRRQTLERISDDALMTAAELNAAGELDEGVLWVRDNDAGPLSLRPVRVDRQTPRYLWEHAEHWLCMSATVISGDVEAQSLGLNAAEIPWTVVSVPMTFARENRPIYAAPCADMSYRGRQEGSWDECVDAIRGILRRHPGERILIHAVSYALAEHLSQRIGQGTERRVYTYKNASERTDVLHEFRQVAGAILVAPSMERGVDLKDDDCRVVIVAKVPYPNLSDKAVGARMHQGREGDVWYAVQTVRALVQMTGRAVRSENDWAATYIVDSQFLTNLWSKWKHLLPGWWKDSMEVINARSLLREGAGA